MKKRICILLSVLLILPAVLSFPVFAESTPSLDTLVCAAKDADGFANMLKYGAGGDQFAFEKGYVDILPEHSEVYDYCIRLDIPDYGDDVPYYPFTDSMNSLAKWKEEVKKYFTEDRYALIPIYKYDLYRLIEYEGKTYSTWAGMGQFYYPLWETAEIVKATADKATIAFSIESTYSDPVYGKFTVTFEKIDGKWLVSGGTYFGLEYYLYLSEEEKTLEQSLRALATEFDEELAKTQTRIAIPSWSMEEEHGDQYWDLIELTPTTAIVACNCRFTSNFNYGPYTMEFAKTSDGWQVSGGSYFEVAYEEEIFFPPAQTGDSAVYALWIAGISLFALGALMYRKKKI